MTTPRNIKTHVRWLLDAAVKGLALFALANLVLGLFSPRWNANDVWIQAGAVPGPVVTALVFCFAVSVLFLQKRHPAIALATRYLAGLLAIACLADAIAYYRLLAAGRITSSVPLPLSLLLAGLLLTWAITRRADGFSSESSTRRALWIRVMDHSAPLVLAAVGVLAHLVTYGATDYRRPADAVLVLGAAVREGGKPSPALKDRTITACRLYHEGLVDTLILSGGRNPAMPISEVECMARIARAEGVPESALIRDEAGANSVASVRTTRSLAETHGWSQILVVSHDYHLARLKLLCDRAGLRAATVPAVETVPWPKKPLFVGREVLAWGWWFLRAKPA